MKKNIIFVTGGTCSGVGKGVILASIGKLLEGLGFSIKIVKIDPYLNQDAGTMNPQEHGEVWVTKSGQETDTDGGTYFRFLKTEEDNNRIITAGYIIQEVFNKERNGIFQGETVRINPHIIHEIKNQITQGDDCHFTLVEIGGTIGEMELNPFLLAIKDFQHDDNFTTMHLNVALTTTNHNNEIKIKPIETLFNFLPYGLTVDMEIIRLNRPINEKEIKKIKQYSYVKNIINLEKADSIYEVPLLLQKKNVHEIILDHFQIEPLKNHICLSDFEKILQIKNNPHMRVIKALIIGKYSQSLDNYKSIDEALLHAATHLHLKISVHLFNLELPSEEIKNYDLVIVAGGFGVNLTAEIMQHIRYIRQNNIPVLLICFGLQLALIEIARNVIKITDATSMEFSDTGSPIICLVDEKHNPRNNNFGGTLRVGAFPVYLNSTSIVYNTYKKYERIQSNNFITEKFRHRYWINKNFKTIFEKYSIHFSFNNGPSGEDLFGFELDTHLHKFFVGVQFHPELSSNIYKPHPLFIAILEKVL